MGRAAGPLQGFLCTVYTDVILILSHLWGHPNTHLMEPLITAPVTLHPVHLQESNTQLVTMRDTQAQFLRRKYLLLNPPELPRI